jgi:hypothetical protein
MTANAKPEGRRENADNVPSAEQKNYHKLLMDCWYLPADRILSLGRVVRLGAVGTIVDDEPPKLYGWHETQYADPNIDFKNQQAAIRYLRYLPRYIRSSGIGLKWCGHRTLEASARATFFRNRGPNGTIVIRRGIKPLIRLATLLHELGHALLHRNLQKTDYAVESRGEAEAEAFSLVVMSHLGIILPSRELHLWHLKVNGYDENPQGVDSVRIDALVQGVVAGLYTMRPRRKISRPD